MAVLVTGAGLLGTWTARFLAEQGEQVVLFDCAAPEAALLRHGGPNGVAAVQGNVCEDRDLARVRSEFPIDGIVHTAGMMGPFVLRHPEWAVRVNVEGTLRVGQLAKETRSRKIIFCSSLAVYGCRHRRPTVREDDAPAPRSLYGATKAAAEFLLLALAQQHDFQPIILRFAGLFGPGTYRGGAWLAPTIDRLLRRLMRGEPASLDFFPEEGVEMLYVKDAARAAMKAYQCPSREQSTFNIGTGRLLLALELLETLRELFPKVRIDVPDRGTASSAHVAMKPLDVDRAKRQLGFVAEYDLRRALADYVMELSSSSQADRV